MQHKKLLSALLTLALCLGLAACVETADEPTGSAQPSPAQSGEPVQSEGPDGSEPPAGGETPPQSEVPVQSEEPAGSEEPTQSEEPVQSQDPAPGADPADEYVRLAFLNGPTGIGAAKLIDNIDSAAGDYVYEVLADNNEAVNLLVRGEVDIAALATNVALNLYNKTEDIQMLVLNTGGVLYILEGGGKHDIQSVNDLQGKTLYAFGQGANPEYILNDLLAQNDLDPDADLTIQWATPEETAQALLSGQADAAMLPVPAATAAIVKGAGQVRSALDLSREWNDAHKGGESSLYMGCLVVRKEFASRNPHAVADFLDDYAASVSYVLEHPAEAAVVAERCGLAPSAAIAEQAIPACNLCCLTGTDMEHRITPYYEVLFQADPASIGGSLPDDGFYYVP